MHTVPSRRKRTIESQIKNQTCRGFSKFSATLLGARRLGEIRGVGPATDRKQNLQLAVLLLEQEKLLDTSIRIVTDIVPRVCRVMLLEIGPRVGQVPAVLGQEILVQSVRVRSRTYTSPVSGRMLANA